MEPLFENKYTLQASDVRETQWKLARLTPTLIMFGIVAALGALVYVVYRDPYDLVFPAALAFICVLLAVVQLINSNRTWKGLCERANGRPIVDTVSFYEDRAVNVTEGAEGRIELDYANVKKIKRTKNMILLITRGKLAHMLRRDAFTKGTEAEFMAFIQSKIALNKLK